MILKFFCMLLFHVGVYAAVPTNTTFQTRIISPTGTPLEAANVAFRFTILDSAGTCALYVEDYTAVNMTGSQGIATFGLGSGAKAYPAGPLTMVEVFNNSSLSFNCQAGGTYVPNPTDRRQVVMQFNEGGGWQTLPQVALNSVFYANYANRSENLGNYASGDYLRPATLPVCTGAQALSFDGSVFTCIAAAAGGGGTVSSVTGTLPVVVTGTTTPVISIAKATVAASGFLSSADWTIFNSKLDGPLTSLTNSSGDITLSPQSLSGAVLVSSGTASTAANNGAFVVSGGVGVSGALNTGGNIYGGANITAATSLFSPVIYGGSTASGNLTLDSTSHVTKGNVVIAPNGGKLGIGTSAPSSLLTIATTDTSTGGGEEQTMLIDTSVSPSATPGDRAGLFIKTSVPGANATNLNEIRGVFSYTTMAGSGNASGINGARLYGEHNSSGTTTEVNGSLMGAGAGSGNVTSLNAAHAFALNYGSNLTNMTGLYVETNNMAGTVANRYSLFLKSPGGPATNDYGIYQEGGGQRNYFAGNVGIGTTAPGEKLQVAGAIKSTAATVTNLPSSTSFDYDPATVSGRLVTFGPNSTTKSAFTFVTVNSDGSGFSTPFYISPGGNVGIGTTTPSAPLHVVGSAKFESTDQNVTLNLQNNASSSSIYPQLNIINYRGVSAGAPVINLQNSGGSLSSPTALGLYSGMGYLNFSGYDGSSNGQIGAVIQAETSEGWSSGGHGAALIFRTTLNGNNSYPNERMRITNSGNVGIGVEFPAVLLDVAGKIRSYDSNGSLNMTGGSYPNIQGTNSSDAVVSQWIVDAPLGGALFDYTGSPGGGNGYFAIRNKLNGGPAETVFRIDKDGKVGIGTTSPQTTLQVAGVISPATNNTYTLGNATYRFTEVYATNGVINTSDRREKKDIYNTDLGLDFINKLRPVSYRWNTGVDNDVHYGLIAQEAEQVIAEVGKTEKTSIVTHDEITDRYGVRYSELISPLIKSVQELYNRLMGVNREIASVKAENIQIKAQAEVEKAAKDKEIEKLKQENGAIKAYLCSKDKKAAICK